ncbi:homoserine kinase [Flavobacteriaceae bacterium]|nr:homoserine kinase [Flavobacteriaceae bacterium]
MNEIKIFCPASVANVSCGFDVLGFCLDPIGDEMIIRKTAEKGIRITKIEGQDLPLEAHNNVAGVAGLALLDAHPSAFGFEIEIIKGIKAGSGIGSSAASSAGAVFGINELLGRPFTRGELIQFAMKGEELASGTPHADNVAPVLLGGFTLVRCSKEPDVIGLPSPSELYATVLHPKIELKTSDARAVLKKNIMLEKAIQQWGNLAALVSGLYTNDYDLIGRSLVDVVIEPHRSALIPGFPELKKAATDSGALGSGISGSGPSMFALSRGEAAAIRVGESMRQAFLKYNIEFELHISKINPKGIHIISSK